jgi:serine/threonine protein kinase
LKDLPQGFGALGMQGKALSADSREINRLGRYVISAQLGNGGMGVVYAAFDPVISREVAIKTIALGVHSDPEEARAMRNALLDEARAVGKLHHPTIVSIYDMGEDKGSAYIVMELVRGLDLSKLMRAGRLSTESIFRILETTASAIDFAHSKGIIHRDIKPGNILIENGGAVKLTDFGIAKACLLETSGHTVRVVGTPKYMSPEQTRPGDVNGKSDQYSLAVVAFELLTGIPPFQGAPERSIFEQICQDPRPSARAINSELPPTVDAVLARALAIRPEDRYASCNVLIAELRRCYGPLAETRRSSLGGKWIAAAVVAVTLMVFGAATRLWRITAPPVQNAAATSPASAPPSAFGSKTSMQAPTAASDKGAKDVTEAAPNSKSLLEEGKLAYLSGGVSGQNKAARAFLRSARLGNTDAMTLLGTIYSQGTGMERNYSRAFYWFDRAAAAGNRRGMDNLAHLYAGGYGVAQDTAEAARWYSKAAEAGDADAMYHLGLLYESGNGVPIDKQRAIQLFQRSAALGKPEAKLKAILRLKESGQDAVSLTGIEPTAILPGISRQYRLTGAHLSLRCLIYVEGAQFVGTHVASNRLVEAAADGSWAKVYISWAAKSTVSETKIVVQDGLVQSSVQVKIAK